MMGKLAIQQTGVAMSRNLALTLQRAEHYAAEQGHDELTLEHLLLSFTEDPDTLRSFNACGVALDRLREELADHLSGLPGDRAASLSVPAHSSQLTRLVADATDATLEAKRSEINSFIVLAALVGNEQSDAARILERHGFTWEKAIEALQSPADSARKVQPAQSRRVEPVPSPEPAEEEPETTTPWPALDEPELAAADAEPLSEEPLPPPSPMTTPQEQGDLRFAAEPLPNIGSRSAKASEKAVATPDDIMASVRQ
ncbi:MAG: hypothetical protein F9K44_11140, partial [Hyphomicrobiaceae bacterium]